MLVLTRKIGEVVTISDPLDAAEPVEVTLLSTRGEIVEIGVTGPAGTSVSLTKSGRGNERQTLAVPLPALPQ